jgi:hypothetical protein
MAITLNGTTGITGMPAIYETATATATAATGTVNVDVLTNTVLYYTTAATGNFTLNVRGASATTLNSILQTGQSVSVSFLATNSASTTYYATAIQVDGATITPKWQGGAAAGPTAINGVDVYNIIILKTASATYTVFASQTRYA